ncbi:hypothetical protein FA13DRAFT_132087 [Coprinellus micaceus]|uniref:BTB domain-containing protein n=1 Tax=Coprinellus micaceus TaxID=71717 RepID=A0A4Y7SIG8_COPMI|nr:hypothetical protein FA13DRAFT_132087 [Coprinellus micaceus]
MSDPVPDVSVLTIKNADDEPTWEVVVFQVEERIFHSFRHVFANASPVFNDRFLVTQNDLGRGSSKEKPIVLDDCNEKDFASLMKVLRPTRKHVSSGDFGLSEEEWLGVLRLSTTWEMKQIQKLSLTKLFQNEEDISPPDLILRAREYRIRSWFVKAVTRIVTGFHRTPTETLISTLGLSTACKIVDLQLDTTLTGAFGPHPSVGTPRKFVAAVPLGRLRCAACNTLLFTRPIACATNACRKVLDPSSSLVSAFIMSTAATLCLSTGTIGFYFNPTSVGCSSCQKQLFPRVTCFSCGETPVTVEKLMLGYTESMIKDHIMGAFKEELEGLYDL